VTWVITPVGVSRSRAPARHGRDMVLDVTCCRAAISARRPAGCRPCRGSPARPGPGRGAAARTPGPPVGTAPRWGTAPAVGHRHAPADRTGMQPRFDTTSDSNVCSLHAGSLCVRATTRRMSRWSRVCRETRNRGLGTVRVHRRAYRASHLLVPALRAGVGGPAVRADRGRHLAGAGSGPAELAAPTRGADRRGWLLTVLRGLVGCCVTWRSPRHVRVLQRISGCVVLVAGSCSTCQ